MVKILSLLYLIFTWYFMFYANVPLDQKIVRGVGDIIGAFVSVWYTEILTAGERMIRG